MADQGERLGLVVAAWTALIRDGDAAEIGNVLDPRVTWQGVRPELACTGRDEVLALLSRQRLHGLHVTRFEAEEVGERVAISVAGPDFRDGVLPAGAARSLVFMFTDGRITKMDSFASRDEAFAALREEASPGEARAVTSGR